MENLAAARLTARSGVILFVGAGLVAFLNSFALRVLGVDGVNGGRMRILATLSLLMAVVAALIPWSRLPRRASIVLAVIGLVLLLASGQWTGYATTDQARTSYPVFFLLIFAWLGMTQPRGTATAFAPVVAFGCAWLTAANAHVSVSFSGLLIAIFTSVLVAETIAWAMARSQRYADDLRMLVSASSELREVLSLAEGSRLAAESTRAVLHADGVALFAVESQAVVESVPEALGSLVADAVVTGEAQDNGDALAIPLVGPSGVMAVVVAYGVAANPVTDQVVALVSSEFGGRLEQLRLLEALGEQTLRDALTGVGSRRHADALVEGLVTGDSLLLIDVDHFKDVNDTRGHLGGDRLLEELGLHLRSGLRDEDAVARYGGDEFLVRLHTHDGDAHAIAQRLLDSWIATGDVPTFSVGIAVHTEGADTRATFAEADRALYASKRDGRARVEVA